MRYLLDTCVLSELTKKRVTPNVTRWLDQQDEGALFLSVITVGELQKGISKLPDSRKRHRLQNWAEHDLTRRFTGRILSIDQETACRWGDLMGATEKKGRKIPVLDGLLAATALVAGMTLVTRNTEDVQTTGVLLFDPWSESPS